MGIELVWQSMKHFYKKRVGKYRVNNRKYSNLDLVKLIISLTKDDIAKDAAMRGWNNINNARPMLSDKGEDDEQPQGDHRSGQPQIMEVSLDNITN